MLDSGDRLILKQVIKYLLSYDDKDLVIYIPVITRAISLNDMDTFKAVWSFLQYKPELWQVLLKACELHSDQIVRLLLSTSADKLQSNLLLLSDLDYALTKVINNDQGVTIRLLTSGALFENDVPLLVYCVDNGLDQIIQYLSYTLSDQNVIDSIKYAIDNNYSADVVDKIISVRPKLKSWLM